MNINQKNIIAVGLFLLVVILYFISVNLNFNQSVVQKNPVPTSFPTVSPIPGSGPVELNNLKSNALISSPLNIEGKIDSSWMFEGSFPIELLDSNHKLIIKTTGKEAIPGSWTTPGKISFNASLTFKTTAVSGFLVFKKDNPSGLPQNDKSFEIPVLFKIEVDSDSDKFCGGIANIKCPSGYTCQLDGNYPDAGGKCVTKTQTVDYRCPSGEWVDCMPMVPEERKFMCEKPYLDWAKANCPGFQGAAL